MERTLGIHWMGDWVGPITGLDAVEKRKFLPLLGLEPRPLCRPARSQSLYRLSYPGPHIVSTDYKQFNNNKVVARGIAQSVQRLATGWTTGGSEFESQ
jgi:hypothetical protein